MARRPAFAYSADIRQIPPELGLTDCRKSLLSKNSLITYQIRMIQVGSKMAGTVHGADVLTFIKSMMYIQGELTSFRQPKGITLTVKNAALVSNISRKVARRAGRV
jgi:hypothetical protein